MRSALPKVGNACAGSSRLLSVSAVGRGFTVWQLQERLQSGSTATGGALSNEPVYEPESAMCGDICDTCMNAVQ
ncbi:hypothetical protein PC116_g23991 [Phytophthora cactorum]|uniref:Uncharacterized protein n=1 Tax=Phytophthora cactorum TaxID=29920 RepID=A0A8T1JWB6_9STRA|nr:hypothetical protein PC115_g20904 [Phytophthora cactorum]KAG2963160.1 hypothetical protein PC118_g21035 [Phytophthora cactorum]KAG4227632.1 hypothetical protein PC116_g23991 [Phytophthora cactorum]